MRLREPVWLITPLGTTPHPGGVSHATAKPPIEVLQYQGMISARYQSARIRRYRAQEWFEPAQS